MKNLILVLTILVSATAFAQKIERERGRFYANGKQISTRETRQLLAANPEALALFKKGKAKQSTGGLLIALGGVAMTADLAMGLFSDVKYPTVVTYIGAAVLLVSIPVLIGKNKKINEGIEMYNNGLKTIGTTDSDYELHVIANQNGCGVQLRF